MSSATGDKPNLPDEVLWTERAVLVGDAVSQMFFGMVVVIFLQILSSLLGSSSNKAKRKNDPPKRRWILIAYTCTVFSFAMIFIEMDLHSLQLGFVDHREFPGGPIAYGLSQYDKPLTIIPNVCAIGLDLLSQGLLLYRCFVLLNRRLSIVALPIIIYLTCVAMGIMLLFQASRPQSHLFSHPTVNFGVPYFTLAAALNVIMTGMITIRLLIYRRELRSAFQSKTHTASSPGMIMNNVSGRKPAPAEKSNLTGADNSFVLPLTSIAVILIESSALYTATSIMFVVPYALGSFVAKIFLANLTMIEALAPLLIVLRIARQEAWDGNTFGTTVENSTLRFRPQNTVNTVLSNDRDGDNDSDDITGHVIDIERK